MCIVEVRQLITLCCGLGLLKYGYLGAKEIYSVRLSPNLMKLGIISIYGSNHERLSGTYCLGTFLHQNVDPQAREGGAVPSRFARVREREVISSSDPFACIKSTNQPIRD